MRIRKQIATANTPPPKGFPKWAWWVLFVATFMFAVPLTSPWWSAIFRSEIGDATEDDVEGATPASPNASPEPLETPGALLKVTLYTRYPDRPGLQVVERDIAFPRGTIAQIQATVAELAIGTPEAPALLPSGTRVVDVAYTQMGTVYLDFSAEFEQSRGVGAEEEKIVVQGIVDTVTENFSAVRRVMILVDGRAPKPGHLDLTRALRKDDPVFAPDEPAATETPAPAGPAPAPAAPATTTSSAAPPPPPKASASPIR